MNTLRWMKLILTKLIMLLLGYGLRLNAIYAILSTKILLVMKLASVFGTNLHMKFILII